MIESSTHLASLESREMDLRQAPYVCIGEVMSLVFSNSIAFHLFTFLGSFGGRGCGLRMDSVIN